MEEIIRKVKEKLRNEEVKPYTDKWYDKMKEKFDNLKHFDKVTDIPEIPAFKNKDLYKEIVVKNLIRCGAIPKNDLTVGKTYLGDCRNTHEATWNGNEFTYNRYKFGDWFEDTINHFEDEMYYDVFIPIKEKKDNIEHG